MKRTGCTAPEDKRSEGIGSTPGPVPTREPPRPTVDLPPGIYAIVDADACRKAGRDPETVAAAFCRARPAALQLRVKHPPDDRALLALARAVHRLCRQADLPFVLDDRADVALLLPLAGLHLGQNDLHPADLRPLLGPDRRIGFSTHSAPQVDAAAPLPVDYLGFGPVFPTGTKEHPDPVTGLDGLAEAVRRSTRPVVAIGGITLERLPAVRRAGARCAALVSALLEGDPETTLRAAIRAWEV